MSLHELAEAPEAYRHTVAEMLDTKAAAVATLRGYIENPGTLMELVMRNPITSWHRYYLAFLERTLPASGEARAAAAGRLCRAMGAMQSSADEVRAALGGNLCRCTGYTQIVESVLDAAGRRDGD